MADLEREEKQGECEGFEATAPTSLEEEIKRIERRERASKRRMALLFGIGLIGFVGLTVFLFSSADQLFKEPIDVVGGEEELLHATNDPVCRRVIESVEDVGRSYRDVVPELDGLLVQTDERKLTKIIMEIQGIRDRLDDQREAYPKGRFRFAEANSQLKKWFDYTDNELSIVQDLALWRKDELLKERRKGERNEKGGGNQGDKGVAVKGEGAEGVGIEEGEEFEVVLKADVQKQKIVGAARIEASSKTPEDLYDGSYLASQEAFETFRVWHTGGLHPCGAAKEGGETEIGSVAALVEEPKEVAMVDSQQGEEYLEGVELP